MGFANWNRRKYMHCKMGFCGLIRDFIQPHKQNTNLQLLDFIDIVAGLAPATNPFVSKHTNIFLCIAIVHHFIGKLFQ